VRSYLARSAWDGTIPDKASPVGYGVTVSRRFRRRSIGTRDTSGIGCARSDRTLRDGFFWRALPGTSCQATIGLSLRDRRCCFAGNGAVCHYGSAPRRWRENAGTPKSVFRLPRVV
jgi:hypothetical protein